MVIGSVFGYSHTDLRKEGDRKVQKCQNNFAKAFRVIHALYNVYCIAVNHSSHPIAWNEIIMYRHSQQPTANKPWQIVHVFIRFMPSQTETLKFLPGKVFCQRRPDRMAGKQADSQAGRRYIGRMR